MKKATPAYGEGTMVAIPLRTGGYGSGVIARSNPRGILVLFVSQERADFLEGLAGGGVSPANTLAIIRVGDLGVKEGSWPIIGVVSPWTRADWAPPPFKRFEQLSGRTYDVHYDDNDPVKVLREVGVKPGIAEQGPSDGLMGAGSAEKFVTRLLDA